MKSLHYKVRARRGRWRRRAGAGPARRRSGRLPAYLVDMARDRAWREARPRRGKTRSPLKRGLPNREETTGCKRNQRLELELFWEQRLADIRAPGGRQKNGLVPIWGDCGGAIEMGGGMGLVCSFRGRPKEYDAKQSGSGWPLGPCAAEAALGRRRSGGVEKLGGVGRGAACAAPPASAPVAKLGAFLGHWVFRGTSAASAQHPATSWTWDEHCRWSSNGVFLECSFDNVWGRTGEKAGTVVQSLVVDTYNHRDHGYWHYELFAGGDGARPFISKMSVQGNTWTELAGHERITYVFTSPREVTVKIESSRDGARWRTEDAGTGRKLDR